MLKIFSMLILSFLCRIHDDLDVQIEHLSKQIQASPDNVTLYSKRGDLFFQQEKWTKSIRDFEKSTQLGNPNLDAQIKIALAWYELDQLDFALEYIDHALEKDLNHSLALWSKGKILTKRGDSTNGLFFLKKAIEHSPKKLPDRFLEIVQLLENEERLDSYLEAIIILDEGIAHLGRLMVFQEKKVELLCKLKKYDSAIKIQTEIINASLRKERVYFKRAQLYQESNNFLLSLKDAYVSREALNELSIKYRFLRSTRALEQQIDQMINQLIKDD